MKVDVFFVILYNKNHKINCLILNIYRLGLAARSKCEEILLRTGWSVELAASILLEGV